MENFKQSVPSSSNRQSVERDRKFLEEALEWAKAAGHRNEVPVGAVLVHEDSVIATGQNLKESTCDPLGHAELFALQEASQKLGRWRLSDCTLYVTLEPCSMCLSAALHARVKRVVFGAKDPKGGALSLGYRVHEDSRLNHLFDVDYVELKECSQILTNFFREKREAKKNQKTIH